MPDEYAKVLIGQVAPTDFGVMGNVTMSNTVGANYMTATAVAR